MDGVEMHLRQLQQLLLHVLLAPEPCTQTQLSASDRAAEPAGLALLQSCLAGPDSLHCNNSSPVKIDVCGH